MFEMELDGPREHGVLDVATDGDHLLGRHRMIDPPDITGGGSSAMGGAAVQLNIRGDDLAVLEKTSNAVMREMAGT